MSEASDIKARRPADGALDRLARDPVSRKRFLTLAGGTGAASAFSIFLAACGDDDDTTTSTTDGAETGGTTATGLEQFGEGDIGILNYALTLEFLEAAFYGDVVKSGLFKGDDLALIKEIGSNEQEHVEALIAAIEGAGEKPATAPKTEFPLESADEVLKLAATVENLGAAAYLGQAAAIESPEVLASALAIHTVEGRHAAALNVLTGQGPTPDGAFAKPADAETVLAEVKPFIVS